MGKGVFVMKRIFYLLMLTLLCTACTAPGNLKKVSAQDRRWLLGGEALAGVKAQGFVVPEEKVLYLSRDMQKFAEKAVDGFKGRDKVTALLRSILYPSGLDLKYDAQATYTAEEAYRYGRANCLSFTHLFTAMARHVNMNVQYNEVDVPPIWDLRKGKTLVLNKHVNALVTRRDKVRHVVDLNLEEFELYYAQRTISDQLAIAQHYNNKAMGYLVAGEYVDALRYLVKAINLQPEVSYFWNNLGSLYRRAGNLQAAEKAYLTALSENSGDLTAYSNLARYYKETGDEKLAAYFEQKAHYYRMQNPYYVYGLSQQAFVEKDYELALKYAMKAIHQYDKEHRFYFLLGAIYQSIGNTERAIVNFDKALELSGDHEQQSRYRNKMDRLLSLGSWEQKRGLAQ